LGIQLLEISRQPRPRVCPIHVDGSLRHTQNLRRLGNAEPGVKPQSDHIGESLVVILKATEGIVERNNLFGKVIIRQLGHIPNGAKRDPSAGLSASFQSRAGAAVFDQNSAHGFCGSPHEHGVVRAPGDRGRPAESGVRAETGKCFVNQSGGGERVSAALAVHLGLGDRLKVGIDRDSEAARGVVRRAAVKVVAIGAG